MGDRSFMFFKFWGAKQLLQLFRLQFPRRLVHIQDVEFTQGRERPLKMDILRPRNLPAEPMPGLVWIHGGAWREGNKEEGFKLLLPFARQGYLCASIEYRLSHEAILPAQLEDCKCAVRFLRAHVGGRSFSGTFRNDCWC